MKNRCFLLVLLALSFLAHGCATNDPLTGSDQSSFEKGAMHFVVMGDNRPADVYKPEQPYIYHKIVNTAVGLNPEIILNTGDIVLGYDALNREKAMQEFDDFEQATFPIRQSNIPLYITMGNHSGYTDFARAEFTRRYQDKETGKLYYSLDIKNSHFVILSSELVGEKTQITGQQLEWLKKDLVLAGNKHKFVVVHRPLYPKITHLEDSLNEYPEKRDQLAQVLKQHNVDMVFVGHIHINNFSVVDGLPQIIAGGSGAPLAGTLSEGGFNHFFHVIVNDGDVDFRLLPMENEVAIATKLLKKGQVQGALSFAHIAMETVPDHPMPYLIAATAYQRLNEQKEFTVTKNKLIQIVGSEKETAFRLGAFALSVKQLDLADQYLTRAYNLDKESFKIIYYNAQLNQQQEQYALAMKRYQQALALTSNKYTIADINKRIAEIKKITKS